MVGDNFDVLPSRLENYHKGIADKTDQKCFVRMKNTLTTKIMSQFSIMFSNEIVTIQTNIIFLFFSFSLLCPVVTIVIA